MDAATAIETARQMDAGDPIASFRSEFVFDDPDLIYLDGNSLGRLPKRTAALMSDVVSHQWGQRLVRGWGEHWIDLPQRVGAKIAQLIGAQPDEVIVCDSTSVNFYKLTMAALKARPNRPRILTDSANFPSDVYLLQGCAQSFGSSVDIVEPADIEGVLDNQVALLTLSHTSFKSGLIQPMLQLTECAHEVGSLTLWDLSHSVGSVPVSVNDCNVDLAVGCTYKYLNGGPGAPAFLYVRRDLQEQLANPIWGWFGQKNPFEFGLEYSPAPGMQSFLTGTPTILSLAAVECGVDLILEAGIDRLRAKSVRQTEFLVELWKAFLEPLGVTLNSPRDSSVRGSHISFGHKHGYQVDQALIEEMNVVPDFRQPNNIRFGVTPISTTYTELAEAVLRMKHVLDSGVYQKYTTPASGVT